MALSKDQSFRSISYEDELERAKLMKEDLKKGDGWSVAASGIGFSYWIKTFHNDDVPIKIVYDVDMPFPAKVFQQLLDPSNLEATGISHLWPMKSWKRSPMKAALPTCGPFCRGH